MTREAPFVTWCLNRAAAHGWKTYHVPAPMRFVGRGRAPVPEPRARGLCDLLLTHPDPARLLFVECKNESNELSPEQIEFLTATRAVGDSIRCWLQAVRELLASTGIVDPELVDPARVPIATYVWRPGMESLIEATLRSKVLPRA